MESRFMWSIVIVWVPSCNAPVCQGRHYVEAVKEWRFHFLVDFYAVRYSLMQPKHWTSFHIHRTSYSPMMNEGSPHYTPFAIALTLPQIPLSRRNPLLDCPDHPFCVGISFPQYRWFNRPRFERDRFAWSFESTIFRNRQTVLLHYYLKTKLHRGYNWLRK